MPASREPQKGDYVKTPWSQVAQVLWRETSGDYMLQFFDTATSYRYAKRVTYIALLTMAGWVVCDD